MIGSKLGPYRVSAKVGEGGMGCVYLAEHTIIGRKVAIKLLNEDVSTDQDAVSRFFTEARSVNQIRHPNIVEVTDLGEADNRYYIVMEYLEGETLGARLNRTGRFDEAGVVNVGRQVASALGAAHGLGMVHRDLKPANIFLRQHPDYPDFVKVLDFGIAKLMSPDASISHQTRVGSLIGTPAYMSPEQCLGEADLDHRSDIYSLGVVLYGMLTGQLPFKDGPLGMLIMAHVTENPVPPIEVNPTVSRSMNAVVMKALAKGRDARWATMKDFRQALDSVIGYVRTPTPMAVPIMMVSDVPSGPIPLVAKTGEISGPHATAATVVTRPPAGMSSNTLAAVASASKDDGLVDRVVAIGRERIGTGKLDLPAMAPSVLRVFDALRAPGFAFGQVAALVAPTPALASRIIRLANSAAFSSLAPAISLEQSIGRLGQLGLQQALLEFEARPILEAQGKDPRVRDVFRRPWHHAMATAILAERLADLMGLDEDTAMGVYQAGLMQEIGKPVMAVFYLGIERQTAGARGPRWMTDEIWMRAVAATYRTVSLMIAREWNRPEACIKAIEEADGLRPRAGREGQILRLATAYANREGFYLRRPEHEAAAVQVLEGKRLLALDDRAEAKLLHGFKERVLLMAGVRG